MALQNLPISEWNIIRENWVQGRTAATPFIFFLNSLTSSGTRQNVNEKLRIFLSIKTHCVVLYVFINTQISRKRSAHFPQLPPTQQGEKSVCAEQSYAIDIDTDDLNANV